MPLELQEIDPATDFPALARAMFETYENPKQEFFHAFFPIHGTTEEAREEAIGEAATRLKAWHVGDPTSHWRKVIDTERGKVAGASLWHIYHENPFSEPAHGEAHWFPDDGSRAFANQVLETHSAPRARVGQRPQVFLFIILTHPDYRRRGVAQKMLNWGMEQADRLGYEFFLESTPYGRPLYEANGFVYVEEYVNRPVTANPDEAWKETEKKIPPFTFWLMWRPAGGKFEEGKTIKPWEKGVSEPSA